MVSAFRIASSSRAVASTPFRAVGARRGIVSSIPSRYPTGQHVAKDAEELEAEKQDQLSSSKKKWSETLATTSERDIRASEDPRSPEQMQKDTAEAYEEAHEEAAKGKSA